MFIQGGSQSPVINVSYRIKFDTILKIVLLRNKETFSLIFNLNFLEVQFNAHSLFMGV